MLLSALLVVRRRKQEVPGSVKVLQLPRHTLIGILKLTVATEAAGVAIARYVQ